eukprot:gene18830-24609_t
MSSTGISTPISNVSTNIRDISTINSVSAPMSTTSKKGKRRSTLFGGADDSQEAAIKVICRFRPMKSNGNNSYINESIYAIDDERGIVDVSVDTFDKKQFSFDKIFGPSTTQQAVFEEVESVVDAVIAGINGTILTYGQTSAGKSFTMEGPSLFDESSQGVISRSISKLFTLIGQANENTDFQIIASYIEVYCERLRDLLNPQLDNMKIRESKTDGFVVQDITEAICNDREGVLRVIELGKANRASAPTLMNAESSRSHSIFSISVHQKDRNTGRLRKARLFLVDLAGSEKVSKTGATGTRLEEAKNINSSLTTLGMVINGLCDGSSHIPYRDSKLTRLLMDALGGNSRTALIICCAPEPQHLPETVSTLRFGERAKKVKNKARVNEELSVDELKSLLSEARKEIAFLKSQYTKASNGFLNNTEFDSEQSAPLTFERSYTDLTSIPIIDDERAELESSLLKAQEDVDRLNSRISVLTDDLEVEKARSEQERSNRMRLQAEVDAVNGTVKDLEEKLLKMTIETKQKEQLLKSSSIRDSVVERPTIRYSEIITDANNQSSPIIDVESIDRDRYMSRSKESPVGKSVGFSGVNEYIEQEDQSVPAISSLYQMMDTVLASININMKSTNSTTTGVTFENDKFDKILSLDEIDSPQISSLSTIDYAEKYVLLREDFEKHLERITKKLTEEFQLRCSLEDELDRANARINALEEPSSPSPFTRGNSHGGGFFSNLFNNGSASMRDRSKSVSSRETQLAKSLEASQIRVWELHTEIETTKEAHAIVLETKDSVLRQLVRQNSQLSAERDSLNNKLEQLTNNIEQLTGLLRSVQSRSMVTLRSSGVIHGGTVSKNNESNQQSQSNGFDLNINHDMSNATYPITNDI